MITFENDFEYFLATLNTCEKVFLNNRDVILPYYDNNLIIDFINDDNAFQNMHMHIEIYEMNCYFLKVFNYFRED